MQLIAQLNIPYIQQIDDYPEIGVQPFAGEPYEEKEQNY